MLVALGRKSLGGADVIAASVLERAFLAYVTRRRELPLDSQFLARAAGPPDRCGHLVIVVEGTLAIAGGATTGAPVAIVVEDTEYERVERGRSRTFAILGASHGASDGASDGAISDTTAFVQLRFAIDHLRVPVGLAHGAHALDPATAAAARRVIADADAETIGAASFVPLLDALGAAGLVAPGLARTIVDDEPERFARLWAAIRPLYAELAAASSLKEISTGLDLSLRQLARDAAEAAQTFNIPAEGFRDITHLLRLRSAVMWLGAPRAAVAEVAEMVGYGSSIAMGRAFRDAGLPPPSEIRAAMRPAR